MAPILEACNNRDFKFEADNVYAVFDHPDDAIRASLEVHDTLRMRKLMLTDNEPFRVCVGIGYGRMLYSDTLEGYFVVETTLACKLGEVVALGGAVDSVFHSPRDATDAAVNIIRYSWDGPICVYPEAERKDYVAAHRDDTAETPVSPDEFVACAKGCVARGVQIIGGCCGVEIDYIRPLRDALPSHLP